MGKRDEIDVRYDESIKAYVGGSKPISEEEM